jgi:hypothetical protein
VAGILVILIGVLAACTTQSPPAPGAVGLGVYTGHISYTSIYYQYNGVAGEQLNVALRLSEDDWWGTILNLGVYAPDLSHPPTVRPVACVANGCSATYQLPVTGRYTIALEVLHPGTYGSMSYWLTLSHDEYRGVAPFESPIPGALDGQVVTYSYAGTAGETLDSVGATVIDPDGNTLIHRQGNAILPKTGTHTIVIDSQATAMLSHDLVVGPVGLGETTTPSLLPGQRALYTYAGTAGEALELYNAGIRDPSGAPVPFPSPDIDRVVLPVSGTYQVAVGNGYFAQTQTFWLSHDLDGGTITPGVVNPPALDPGQAIAYHYAGVAGETLTVSATKVGAGTYPTVMLFAPDGSQVASNSSSISSVLPVSGTYLIVALPSSDNQIGSITVTSTP